MKRFIFNQNIEKRHKRSGTLTYYVQVYALRNNEFPVSLGAFSYNTGSTRGVESEVMNYLIRSGYIKGVEEGYYDYGKSGKFLIREI